MRWWLCALSLALVACAGPSESATDEASEAVTESRWWHGTWVVDRDRLQPDEHLSPAARQTARSLAATFAETVRFELSPDGVRRAAAGQVSAWRLERVGPGADRVVLDLVGGRQVVLERGPEGVVLSDGAGSRPVRRP